MRLAPLFALFACLGLACSGSPGDTNTAPARGQPQPARTDGAPAASATPSADASLPLTRADCEELIAHITDIALREDAQDKPEMPPPTDEEISAMREQLLSELGARCEGKPRRLYECGMSAQSREELAACDRKSREGQAPTVGGESSPTGP